jgi:hypothetical protein
LAAAATLLGFAALATMIADGAPRAPLSLRERIDGRSFPSIFQAWNPADNMKQEDRWVTMARHDLVFHGSGGFGLVWDHRHEGLATRFTAESLAKGREIRRRLLALNPSIVLLMEVRYRDAWKGYLPEGHPWWEVDASGKPVLGWEEGGYLKLDYARPAYRQQVAAQAKAAVESGVFDGVLLDWWQDDDARLELARAVRKAIGEDALILANANDRTTPRTAPFLNGYFMECYRTRTREEWARIAETLKWAEANLRRPRVNCLETWYHASRNDRNLMRATTTLALTLSDGYCLFSDPNPLPTPDHLHDWYPFWDKSLGRPVSRARTRRDGAVTRDYEKGTVLYNPMGGAVATISFPEPRLSLATAQRRREHRVQPCDGDIFLKDGAGR